MATAKPELSKRRRFQPPITTFFTASSDSPDSSVPSHLSYNHYSAITNSPTPVVPAKVQASLLSVGMRVRKSLADGYKTNQAKEKHNTFLYNEDTVKSTHTHTHSTYNPSRSELAPFSGMSRTNEYPTSQTLPRSTYNTHDHDHITTDENNDAFSLPPSSQESFDSDIESSNPIPSFSQKKRTHHEFDFDPYEDDDDEIDSGDDELPPTWQDPLRLNPVTHATGRTILSPTINHQRRRAFGAQKKSGFGQTMDLDDFEEPAFLRRREEVDMDVDQY